MFLKKIADISIKNGQIGIVRGGFPSVVALESQIAKLPYGGAAQNKNPDVENSRLPPFIQVFYYLFFQQYAVPSQDAFWQTYCNWTEQADDREVYFRHQSNTFAAQDVKNRLLRSYPSLIRDLHFYFVCLESCLFEEVVYSLKTDFERGIDLSITYKGNHFAVSIFTDTRRGRAFKQKKDKRHDYSGVTEIILDVNLNDLNKKGNFFLMGYSHVQRLLVAMQASGGRA